MVEEKTALLQSSKLKHLSNVTALRSNRLSIKIVSFQDHKNFTEKPGRSLRGTLINSTLFFLLAYLILFFGMPLRPNIYDEGIVLTASMRVAAGQLPHRDFYAIYGPAQFYILAGLYRLFGESLLVERLLDLLFRALLVASVYTVASSYFRRSVAVCTSLVTLAWLFGLYLASAASAVIPVSLFNLVSTALIIPVFTRTLSRRRTFGAGVLAGMAALFRYDTGIALIGIHIFVIAIGIYMRCKDNRWRAFVSAFSPYLPGFALVTLPPALYYLSVAPLHPLIHDVVLFPSKYYHRARNLPFPAITLKGFDNFAVYLPIALVGISFYAVVAGLLKMRDHKGSAQSKSEEQQRYGFLVAFGLLTFVMYFKGFVRISVIQMYLAIIPSLLLAAALFQDRFAFPRRVRISIVFVVWLSLLSPAWCSLREIKGLYVEHCSLPENVWSAARRTAPAIKTTWCSTTNPATRGLCFLPEDDRIQTVEFIDNHTRPDQKLFVGVTHHDKIFANDNLIYFASHRLPATRWSHFDPDLQSRPDIQAQIVQELEVNIPPYVVLDSEFDRTYEPNDSSRSSGVTLLDEYLHKNYQYTQTFGSMSIWQRITAP
jgi:Dolichyl-phosphate-mannose-protein mannosyltransferase